MNYLCMLPKSHVEEVKTAMLAAGAGKLGNYSCCAWQVKGRGSFVLSRGVIRIWESK